MKNSETLRIRAAQSHELTTLIAIDDDASSLYDVAGLNISLDSDHPFVLAEAARWKEAIQLGLAHVAVDNLDQPLGFIALGFVDGEPYLDQLAVRRAHMQRGIGSALLRHAISWSGEWSLWLTTYSHLSWNAPYYEKHGFSVVPEDLCGPELRGILDAQRSALPEPDKRIAMVRRGSAI